MHKSYVWSSVGGLLVLLGIMLLLPTAVGLYYGETEYIAFLICAGAACFIGALLYFWERPVRGTRQRMHMKDGYAIVTYVWLVAVLMAMGVYMAVGMTSSITDAFFEAVSGFTMTGATILSDVESQAKCVLMWRSVTQ